MFDPIVNFFTRVFQAIGRGIGLVIAWICWPFVAASRWYARRGWLIKGPIGIGLLVLIVLSGYFSRNTRRWTGFAHDYVQAYSPASRNLSAGEQVSAADGGDTTRTCGRSAVADVTADLVDFNVHE